MSQRNEQSDLFEAFLEEKGYEERMICPYCGTDRDESDVCCGEKGHASVHWINERETLAEHEVKKEFKAWLEERAERAENSRHSEKDEPEYWEDR
jgi:hypothetical protein